MTKYEKNKENARAMAIDWQNKQSNLSVYMSEVIEQQEKFIKLAKRYGLTREFRENGII